MDIRLKKNFLTVALLTAIGATSVGCHDKDTTTDSSVTEAEAPAIAATLLAVVIADGATGAPLLASATVTPVGTDAELDKLSSEAAQTISTGSASFELAEGVDPTAESFRVAFKVEAEGYITTNNSVVVDQTGTVELTINLVEETVEPEGVSVVKGDAVDAGDDGALAEELTLAASVEVDAGVSVASQITVPAAIVVTDDAGDAVTGALTPTITHYDASTTEALDSFPGGLNVAIANPEVLNAEDTGSEVDADTGELTFLSAGFTSVEITNEAGDEVANFEAPDGALNADNEIVDPDMLPRVDMQIPEGTVNPETGEEIAVGDTDLKIWSFDVDTGKWQFEAESSKFVTVEDNDTSDGLLDVSYPVTHLSYWNLDYFRAGAGRCTGTINLIDSTTDAPYVGLADLDISAASLGWSHYARFSGTDSLTLLNSPADVQVTVTVTDTSGTEIGMGTVANLCEGDRDVVVTPPTNVEVASRTATIIAESSCSNAAAIEAAGLTVPNPTPIEGVRFYFFMQSPQFQLLEIQSTGANGTLEVTDLVDTITTTTGGNSTVVEARYLAYVYNPTSRQWDVSSNQTLSELLDTSDSITYDFPSECSVTTGASSGSGTL